MIAVLGMLWVAQTFREHATLEGHRSIVSSVSFSADSRLIATGSSDETVRIWDVADGRLRSTLEAHEAAVLSVKFSAKDASLISVDYRNRLAFWDRVDGPYKLSRSEVLTGIGEISAFEKQRLGDFALFTSTKYHDDKVNRAKIPYWNLNSFHVEDSRRITSTRCDDQITAMAISPDGSLVSIGDGRGFIRVLSRGERDAPVEIKSLTCPLDEEGEPGAPGAIAFHPRNEFVAFSCADNSIRLWRWSEAAPFAVLAGHTKYVDSLAISPDGEFLVSGSPDLKVRIWSLKSLKNLHTIQSNHYISSIAISNDSNYIAWGDYNNKARIWAVAR